jgi:hypothetical protein
MLSYSIQTSLPSVTKAVQQQIVKGGHVTFATLDNGGEPFRLTLFPSYIQLRDNSDEMDDDDDDENHSRGDGFSGFSIDIKHASEIWIGTGAQDDVTDLTYAHYFGSAALIIIPSRLPKKNKGDLVLVVSSNVSAFTLDVGERVVRFVSTVGNSAVSYGWIETTKGKYFLKSFNCSSGFLAADVEVSDPFCVDDTQVHLQKIKNLVVMIPPAW